jgi:hypothetical protein
MNSLYKIGFFIIILGIGYIAGNKIPIEIFKPNYTEVTFKKTQIFKLKKYYRWIKDYNQN